MAGVGKAAAIGLGAAAAGFGALSIKALNMGGDLEQSLGGIETLFKDSADIVIKNAEEAYLTAGLNANDYMQQVTSFSASLLQSLGGDTETAAKVADMAVIDMADNANKMGTSTELIQNAYQGFAKQNYMMLDNLKLGYGGTKTEMERLLSDAERLSGIDYDISNLNDVYEAIHVVQTELGITGTTAKEGLETLTGSIATAKSAFSNFLSGAGGVGEVVTSFTNAGNVVVKNMTELLPRLSEGFTQIITGLTPMLPEMFAVLLPAIIQGASALINGLVSAMPEIIGVLVDVMPTIVDAILTMLPLMATAAIEIMVALSLGISEMLPTLIPTIVEVMLKIVETLIDNIDLLVMASITLMVALADGLIRALPKLLAKAPIIIAKLATAITTAVPKALGEVGGNIIVGMWNGIKDKGAWLKDKITGFFGGVVDDIKSFFGIKSPSTLFRDEIGKMLPEGMAEGIKGGISDAVSAAQDMADAVFNAASVGADFGMSVSGDTGIGGFDLGIGDSSSYETIEYSETAEIQSQASVIADIISQTLYGGLALIADTIFNSLPDKVDLNINGQTLVEATWDDSSNIGNRRGQLFAPTESEIRDIAMSAIGSLGGI